MKIHTLRMSQNMTQNELAEKIGVTRSAVAMWETGEARPRSDKIPILAKCLGCTIEDLFEDETEIK